MDDGIVVMHARTPGSRLSRAALAGLLVFCAESGRAQPAVQKVLLLQSLARGNLALDSFTSHFRVDLDRQAGKPTDVVQIVVSPTETGSAPEAALVGYIRSIFSAGPEPDLIVTSGGPAAVFARRNREQLFPDTPLLLAAVDHRFLRNAPLEGNETSVAVVNDPSRVIEDILQILPETRQVFMIMGIGTIRNFWRRELDRDFRRFHDRLTFVWTDDLSLSEIMRRSASLPPGTAIFYFNFGTDAAGAAYADERVLADLHATASAPIFGLHSVMLGHGVVGGTLMPIEDLAQTTAGVAVRLLNGAPPASIRVPPRQPGPPVFDWRELERWNIAESRLPAGSVVRYRRPSLWSQHRVTALSVAAALIIQSLLIAGLVFTRRARQRAEIDSRRNLAIAADVSRRQTMSALTSSIAHELGQPLTSMMADASTLQILVATDRATPDAVMEILSDIQAQGTRATQIIDRHRKMLKSRRLEMKPIDLHALIHESLALVAHDTRELQIETTVAVSSSPCIINGDSVLLQQVLLNLVMNAIDAMRDTPPSRRQVTIRSEVRAAEVELSVRDAGTGLPLHILGALFKPVATAKPDGLGIGLTIARTIVEAHGGTIGALNHPDGGAVFTVTLRRAARLAFASGS